MIPPPEGPLSQGMEELPQAESSIVACALLPDYYVRSGADRLEDVPQIKAELQRIWSDYDFGLLNGGFQV